MTWRELVSKADAYLGAKGVEDSRVCAELLASRLLKCGRGSFAALALREVHEKHVDAMRRGVKRLAAGEPVQYVLGEWDFRTLTLKCDRRALIPRPETEELVTRVLARLGSLPQSETPPFVVDVGTGTGAIALSVSKEFQGPAIVLGTDVSEDAIALARENAARCGLEDRARFVVMDGLDDFDEPETINVIVSNPPYIESAVCDTLERK